MLMYTPVQDRDRRDANMVCPRAGIIAAPSILAGVITGVALGATSTCTVPVATGAGFATGFGVFCVTAGCASFFTTPACHATVDDEELRPVINAEGPYMRIS